MPSSSGGKRKAAYGSVPAAHPQTAGASARALHEYQFLPEQPSVRADVYERVAPSHLYDTPIDAPIGRAAALSAGGPYHHGSEQVAAGYNFQGQVPNVSLLSQQGRQNHVFPSGSTEYDSVPHKNSLMNIGTEAQFGTHPIIGLENPFVSSNRRVSLDEDPSRMERKRKVIHNVVRASYGCFTHLT